MVTQVYGTMADKQIIFDINEDGLWTATVPAVPSGLYVIALYALDEAGNEAYVATAICAVDVCALVASIEIIDYDGSLSSGDYSFSCH